jgi:outer membrane protein assembly factor BamB
VYSHLLGIGNGTENAGNVAATGGAVYASIFQNAAYGGEDALLSLDARTGAVRWQVAGVFGDPAVAGGRVFAGTVGGRLQARSAATGALLWSRPGGTVLSAPSVTGGMVYALGTENGASRLFARRADTGALAWKRSLPGRLTSAWPAVAGGKVLATTSAGIGAFDGASGAARWRVAVAGASSPAVANGLVFAGLGQGIGAWRLSDGVRRWSHGTIGYGAPVVSAGRLYVAGSFMAGDQPVTVVDQFALGPVAPGAVS